MTCPPFPRDTYGADARTLGEAEDGTREEMDRELVYRTIGGGMVTHHQLSDR